MVAEISCAKISEKAPLEKVCLFGCGVSTGLGAVLKTCSVEEGASVAVFGLGAVGLAVIQAAKLKKARRIFAVCTRVCGSLSNVLAFLTCLSPSHNLNRTTTTTRQ